jgi:hypothetical protein
MFLCADSNWIGRSECYFLIYFQNIKIELLEEVLKKYRPDLDEQKGFFSLEN